MTARKGLDRGDGLPWTVGESAYVFAFGKWYRGTVVKVAPKRVTVQYSTSSGIVRDKAVGPGKVVTVDGEVGHPDHRVPVSQCGFDFRANAGKMDWDENLGRYVRVK